MIGAVLVISSALVALEPPPTEPPPPHVWYGAPAVVSDAAATTLFFAGLAGKDDIRPELLALGVAGFALGAPFNHADHGHVGRAVASFGLRAGAAAVAYGLVAAVAGSSHCSGEHGPADSSCTVVFLSPFLILGAMIGDDLLLAREPAPTASAGVSVSPAVAIARGGGIVSLGGAF
jgi:hypothetical protein